MESSGNYWRQRTILREQPYCTFHKREWPRNQTRVRDDTNHPRYRTHVYKPIYTLYKPSFSFTLSSRNKKYQNYWTIKMTERAWGYKWTANRGRTDHVTHCLARSFCVYWLDNYYDCQNILQSLLNSLFVAAITCY